jgi:hypothetical protein
VLQQAAAAGGTNLKCASNAVVSVMKGDVAVTPVTTSALKSWR